MLGFAGKIEENENWTERYSRIKGGFTVVTVPITPLDPWYVYFVISLQTGEELSHSNPFQYTSQTGN